MCARNERRGSAVRKRWRCVLPGSGGFFLSKKNEDIVHFDLPANTVLAPPTRLLADYPPILWTFVVAYVMAEGKGGCESETLMGLSWC